MVREVVVLSAIGLFAATACGAEAPAEDGSSVVVLVNAGSRESEEVGAHYAKVRGVPAANICRVRCSTGESMSRREFEESIRGPLRKFLLDGKMLVERADGGAELKVKYLVSAWGVPVKVREEYPEPTDAPKDAKAWEAFRRIDRWNRAAVDSELCLIALAKPALEGWVRNSLMYEDGDTVGGRKASPLLFATRLDGPTAEVAKGLVDAAVKAEREGQFGIAYIDTRGQSGGPYAMGDAWLRGAAAAAQAAGFFTRIDWAPETFDADMPMPDAALYFGWYEPALCGPMAKAGFRFAPGAVAYHLHSGSAARVRTERLGWCGPLVSKGAAATMGAVFEPSLGGTVDIAAFAANFLSGRTFGESVYRATPHLSWMMTYIGDPLYAPFRADLRKAALDDAKNAYWRDVQEAVRVSGGTARALGICEAHKDDPLFVELAGRTLFQAGRAKEAMERYVRLAALAKDEYSAVRAWSVAGDWFASQGDGESALKEYLGCVRAHGKTRHAIPVYRKAVRVARALGRAETEVELWKALAANFPERALGRFAGGELWVRGLEAKSAVPVLEVRAAVAAPVVDGKPDDEAWKDAAAVKGLRCWSEPRRAAAPVLVRVTHDAKAVFVLAEVAANGRAGGGGTDEEFFGMTLSPWRDGERAVRVVVHGDGRVESSASGVVCRTAVAKAGEAGGAVEVWLVEIEVPFASLGLKELARDSVWSANFAWRWMEPRFPFRVEPVTASWAAPDADALVADCAGHVMFR